MLPSHKIEHSMNDTRSEMYVAIGALSFGSTHSHLAPPVPLHIIMGLATPTFSPPLSDLLVKAIHIFLWHK